MAVRALPARDTGRDAAGGGTMLEGVLDLAWEDDQRWTVVDFKTDTELSRALPRYRRQISLYASVIARTTGRAVKPVLMHV